jgi:hypothetical protein
MKGNPRFVEFCVNRHSYDLLICREKVAQFNLLAALPIRAAHRITDFVRQHFVVVGVALPVPNRRLSGIARNAELAFV